MTTVVDGPGVYEMEEATYHSDPIPGGSLSCSGAKLLIPPNPPAKFAYARDHADPTRTVFEVGAAAHKIVLGTGPELVLVDRPRWDTNEVKAKVADIRASGGIPLKADTYAMVHAMAAALREHPSAAMLLDPDSGQPERSLFWRDKATRIICRARLDWLRHRPTAGTRLLVADYKTAESADDEKFQRAAANYGYHMQAAWYLDGVRALDLADDAAFLFIVQEKTPPYLVNVVELDTTALAIGAHLNRQARETFAVCNATGTWPGYGDDVHQLSLPPYIERQFENEDIYV